MNLPYYQILSELGYILTFSSPNTKKN